MINEDVLLKQLQNGIQQDLKIRMLYDYRNYWQIEGFEKGFQNCTETMRSSSIKRKQIIEKRKNELLDELRDLIWEKIENGKNNISSRL